MENLRVTVLKARRLEYIPDASMTSFTNLGFPSNPLAKPTPTFYNNFKILKIKEYNNIWAAPYGFEDGDE
jgi:hypothetical protein